MIKLRDYQEDSVKLSIEYMRDRKHPAIVLPTGAGKTFVIADIVRHVIEHDCRVLCLTHDKKLIQQLRDSLPNFVDPSFVGVHCAGLSRRDTIHPIILGSVQTVVNVFKGDDNESKRALGEVDLVIVDEAHYVNVKAAKSSYMIIFNAVKCYKPSVRFCGLTATPYRDGVDLIYGEDKLFDACVDVTSITELIEKGVLSDIITPEKNELMSQKEALKLKDSLAGLRVQSKNNDFNQKELADAYVNEDLIESSVRNTIRIIDKRARRHVIVFCVNIEHAEQVHRLFNELEPGSACLSHSERQVKHNGKVLSKKATEELELKRFTQGHCKYLVNVGQFTTGFDYPGIDSVVLFRPTGSLVLFQQMTGRGLRKAEGKEDCLLLDFGMNLFRHGTIDDPHALRKPKIERKKKKPKKLTGDDIEPNGKVKADLTEDEEEKLLHQFIAEHADAISQRRIWYDVKSKIMGIWPSPRNSALLIVSYPIEVDSRLISVQTRVSIRGEKAWQGQKLFKTFTGITDPELAPTEQRKFIEVIRAERKPSKIAVKWGKRKADGSRFLHIEDFKFDTIPTSSAASIINRKKG